MSASATEREIVAAYWADMNGNDFAHAARWFSDDFRLYWPQSSEVIVGRADFAALNAAYPAAGPWRFDVVRLVGEGPLVVSDATVTDVSRTARAVTFHRVVGGRIVEQVEYWPDDYEAPAWRAPCTRRGLPPVRSIVEPERIG